MNFAENKSTPKNIALCIYVSKWNNSFTDVIEIFAEINVSNQK